MPRKAVAQNVTHLSLSGGGPPGPPGTRARDAPSPGLSQAVHGPPAPIRHPFYLHASNTLHAQSRYEADAGTASCSSAGAGEPFRAPVRGCGSQVARFAPFMKFGGSNAVGTASRPARLGPSMRVRSAEHLHIGAREHWGARLATDDPAHDTPRLIPSIPSIATIKRPLRSRPLGLALLPWTCTSRTSA